MLACCQIVGGNSYQGYKYMVMTLLGPSLEDIRLTMNNQKLSLATALNVAKKCLQAIEELHRTFFYHLSANNLVFRTPPSSQRYQTE